MRLTECVKLNCAFLDTTTPWSFSHWILTSRQPKRLKSGLTHNIQKRKNETLSFLLLGGGWLSLSHTHTHQRESLTDGHKLGSREAGKITKWVVNFMESKWRSEDEKQIKSWRCRRLDGRNPRTGWTVPDWAASCLHLWTLGCNDCLRYFCLTAINARGMASMINALRPKGVGNDCVFSSLN